MQVGEIAEAVRSGRMSASDVLEEHLERIEARNGELNAVVHLDAERARAAAAAGPRGPLAGVPFTVKEAIVTVRLPGREASWLRPLELGARDATAVARLRAAGAILVGKTNTSELCAHPDSVNAVYGATRNPFDPERSAGGSSGGEAVAVATGMSAFGLGSDYGGSIRAPASFCGVAGIRPGLGRVPVDGHLPHAKPRFREQLATIGPLALSVADLELVLSVLADAPIGLAPLPPRVGIFRDALDRSSIARSARRPSRPRRASSTCEVAELVPPFQLAAEELFDAISAAEARETIEALGPLGQASPQLQSIARGTAGAPPAPPDAGERLALLAAEAERWLADVPVLLAPAAAEPAFALGILDRDVFELFHHCKLASALGLPAAVVPVALSAAGLPIGVQVIGRRGREDEVLGVARAIELGRATIAP